MSKRLILACLVFAGLLRSSEFCAIHLKVVSATGEAIAAAGTLIDAKGAIVAVGKNDPGMIDFCDFDFGDHSIVVEADGYMKTTIFGVRILYFEPQMLTAVLNRYAWGDGGMNGCPVDLRVKNTEGRPIPFPSLTVVEAHSVKDGDKYGRIAAVVLSGRQRTFRIAADGYGSVQMSVLCDPIARQERTVILRRQD